HLVQLQRLQPLRAGEVAAEQLQPLEGGAVQVGAPEVAVLQAAPVEVGVGEVGVPEADLGEVALLPFAADELETGEVGVRREEVLEGRAGVIDGNLPRLAELVPLRGSSLEERLDGVGLGHGPGYSGVVWSGAN